MCHTNHKIFMGSKSSGSPCRRCQSCAGQEHVGHSRAGGLQSRSQAEAVEAADHAAIWRHQCQSLHAGVHPCHLLGAGAPSRLCHPCLQSPAPFNASTSGRTVQIDMFSLHHSTALSTWVWQPCMSCTLTAAMLCASVAHIKDFVDDLQSWHDTTASHTSCRPCWSGESPGGPAGGGIMEPRSQRLLSATGGPPGPTPGGPPCAAPM